MLEDQREELLMRLSLKPICENLKKKLNENIKLINKKLKEIDSSDLL